MTWSCASIRSCLLAVLSAEELDRLLDQFVSIDLDVEEDLIQIQANDLIEHVYFLERGIGSIVADTARGRIEEATDGPAALKVLRSNARIDLLVTDVGLPGGMNGRQVADAARTSRPGLKVLFITGYAENAAVGNGHLDPGMAVLTKPFVMEALASRIRELIAAT